MADVFSAHAGVYDRSRRQLIPCFDAFYGSPARILGALGIDPKICLDLGAGTGLLSAILSREITIEKLVLLDQSEPMLRRGCETLTAIPEVGVAVCRLQDIADADLPMHGFDAIWSSLAIHHLCGSEKQKLFADILDLLRPGGVFINADQSLAPTPELEPRYHEEWLRQVKGLGVNVDDLDKALDRMKEDRMDPLADQLAWLHDAGFTRVNNWFQDFSFNVYAAVKPTEPQR